jgi:hypothetical protein
MTAPEQPTPEAIAVANELWWILGSRGGDARQGAIRDAAERIDRFAAQRAAEAVAPREHAPDVPCPVTGNDRCSFGYCRETPGCYLRDGNIRGAKPEATSPPGDAGERARALAIELGLADQFAGPYPDDVRKIAAALQSERTAAARENGLRDSQPDNRRDRDAAHNALDRAIEAYFGEPMDVNDIDPDSVDAAAIERIDAALTAAASQARREAAEIAERFHDEHERAALAMDQGNPDRVKQFEFANVARAIEIFIRALATPQESA